MKKIIIPIIIILLFGIDLTAQNVVSELLKDINVNQSDNVPNEKMLLAGDKVVYIYDDFVHGNELWLTDGTEAGTLLLKDISEGSNGGASNPYFTFDELAYFFSYNEEEEGVWRTDGTAAGTQLFLNTYEFQYLGLTADYFYYVLNETELWRSDGTTEGTIQLYNFSSSFNINTNTFTVFNNEVYGVTDNNLLWKSDDTISGTVIIKDFGTANIRISNGFHAAGSYLIFIIGADEDELWTTDGTTIGTTKLDVFPMDSYYYRFASTGNLTYFVHDDNGQHALWVSDGTALGTTMIRAMNIDASNKYTLYAFGNQLLFFDNVDDSFFTNTALFSCSGTTASVQLIKDFDPIQSPAFSAKILINSGEFYFALKGLTNKDELWKTDGTTGGTVQLQIFDNGFTNTGHSNVKSLFAIGNQIFFVIDGNVSVPNTSFTGNKRDLWRSDGTTVGTTPLTDYPISAEFRQFVAYGNKMLYQCDDRSGRKMEIWQTDGTVSGTDIVKDVLISDGSFPKDFTLLDEQLFFLAAERNSTYVLYETDGSTAGTVPLLDSEGEKFVDVEYFTKWNNKIAFIDAGTEEDKLVVSDGTTAGTAVIFTKAKQNISSTGVTQLVAFNDILLFYTNDGIWRSDGTNEGTVLISPYDHYPSFTNHTIINGILYYYGYSTVSPNVHAAIYQTNGMENGTTRLMDLNTSSFITESIMEWAGNDQYFVFDALDDNGETRLWKSDGTVEGTGVFTTAASLAKPEELNIIDNKVYCSMWNGFSREFYIGTLPDGGDTPGVINLSDGSNRASDFAALGDQVIFNVSSNATGLWKTDGTEAGTIQISEIANSSREFIQMNGQLYFSASTNEQGFELWRTDGTDPGTQLVSDIFPGDADSSPKNIFAYQGSLYFSAKGNAQGTELFKYTPPSLPLEIISFSGISQQTSNLINWESGSESDILHYEVQRSTNGKSDWKIIDRLVYANNHSGSSSYQVVDSKPLLAAYYRLKITEESASRIKYSNILFLERTRKENWDLEIYPNPVNNTLTLSWKSDRIETIAIKITSIDGKVCYQQTADTSEVVGQNNNISLNDLANGIYYLQLFTKEEVQIRKFVKNSFD